MKHLRILVVLVFVFLVSTEVWSQKATRINFSKNATATTISGNLKSYADKKVFVIKVRRGQTLTAEQIISKTSTNYVTVSIKDTSGETVGDEDASCNSSQEAAPTVADDYTITVVECQKADAWNGSFRLRVAVK